MNFQTFQGEQQEPEAEPTAVAAESSAEEESLTGEPAKSQVSKETLGLMGVLLACGAVVGLMYLRNGPQSAGAATGPENAAVVDAFLGNSDEHVTMMRKSLQSTDKVVEDFRNYAKRPQVPLSKLRANPFKESEANRPATAGSPQGNNHQQQERAEAMKAAESLQLQSVLRGPHDACLINNSLVEQGQQVNGFTVELVKNDSVVVRKGAYRFEIRMGK